MKGRPSDAADGTPRLKPERMQIRVELFSTEAEEYQVDSKWWGTLPAWCKRCGGHHRVSVDTLRTAYWDQARDVLVPGNTVR